MISPLLLLIRFSPAKTPLFLVYTVTRDALLKPLKRIISGIFLLLLLLLTISMIPSCPYVGKSEADEK